MAIYEGRDKVWRWSEYYDAAREVYANDMGTEVSDGCALYELTMKVHDPKRETNPVLDIGEGTGYMEAVERLSTRVDELMQDDTKHVRQGMANGLKTNWDLEEELVELVNILKPQMEEKLFGSYVNVDNCKIYRSFTTSEPCRSSWTWHIDNNPEENIKILIYLTDVKPGTGQFEFITNGKSTEAIKIPTSRVAWDEWTHPWDPRVRFSVPGYKYQWGGTDRVHAGIIDALLKDSGCRLAQITGQKGKLLLFDNNIIHRATTARAGHRDAIVLQFKPSLMPVDFNRETCGDGWKHQTFNVCPSAPLLPLDSEHGTEVQLDEIRELVRTGRIKS
jgi:hypothetical protein